MIVKNYLNRKIPTSLAFLIILLLAVLVGRFAWQNYTNGSIERIGASEVKILEKKGGLPLSKLRDAEYGTCYNSRLGKVKFTEGTFSQPPEDPQWSTGGWTINIVENMIASGDLNNDGRDDDVLVLRSFGGGSGSFYEITAVINKDGEPLYFDCRELGDRVKINSLKIDSGKIIVNLLTHSSEDPMCCPTVEKTINYQISGNKLIEI